MILPTNIEKEGSELLAKTLEAGRKAFAEFGCEISVHGDFNAFCEVDRGGAHLFHGYHNHLSTATRGTSIHVHKDGRTIGTYACAMYEAYTNMADLIESIDLYSDDTEDRFVLGGSCRDWLECATGRVAFSGGIWVNKEFTGTDLSHFCVPGLPILGRAIAVECWGVHHIVGLVPEIVMKKGIAQRYRMQFLEPGGGWETEGHLVPLVLAYNPPIQVIYDARRFIEKGRAYLQPEQQLQNRTDSSERAA